LGSQLFLSEPSPVVDAIFLPAPSRGLARYPNSPYICGRSCSPSESRCDSCSKSSVAPAQLIRFSRVLTSSPCVVAARRIKNGFAGGNVWEPVDSQILARVESEMAERSVGDGKTRKPSSRPLRGCSSRKGSPWGSESACRGRRSGRGTGYHDPWQGRLGKYLPG
jgi:hypothetical protein